MIRHLNSLNPFGPNLFWFGWDVIDNFEGQKSNVLKYPSDYPQVNLFTMNSIDVIDASQEMG